MTQATEQHDDVEERVRLRIRSLRTTRGWSLDELGERCHLNPSTLSRIETGRRRIALDQLVPIARALETTVEELLDGTAEEDVVIRPDHRRVDGVTVWPLSKRQDDGPTLMKMRIPATKRRPDPRVHPGRDWFYVLSGTARLVLGDRELLVETGQAAEFDTMTPHWIGSHGGPVELVVLYDHHGERSHVGGG